MPQKHSAKASVETATCLQGDFGLSKFQLGLLAAMFMVGLMIASVALTQLTAYISPFRLVGELHVPATAQGLYGSCQDCRLRRAWLISSSALDLVYSSFAPCEMS